MYKILFVCLGNICRSPTAEFVMKDLVKKAGLEHEFEIASAATSSEEEGWPIHTPARLMLEAHGIDCAGKTSRPICRADYEHYDFLIGMDSQNIRNMRRVFGDDAAGKIHYMMEFAGKPEQSVADPWYSGDFERAWQDISAGCEGLLYELTGTVVLDFSSCTQRQELYAELRSKMDWQDWYGENLDALYDVLTGFPRKDRNRRFVIILPTEDAPTELKNYADRIVSVFKEANIPVFIAP